MMSIRDYFVLLNDEATVGDTAALALVDEGVGGRGSLLAAHPEWHRLGTFYALLVAARDALDRDALTAFELTSFVLEHCASLPASEPGFIRSRLVGRAWKEHGNALFMLNRLPEALNAALKAAEIYASEPLLCVDRGSALVLLALIVRAEGRFDEAKAALVEAEEIFGEHGESRRYVAALQTEAMIALDQENLPLARERYLRAFAEADRLDDDRERARIWNNLGHVALRAHDLETATEYLAKALSGFRRARMEGELQRAIWGIASVARERGNLTDALTALHGAYPKLLERGLVADAMAVLVDIGDVVVELTGDVAYAQSLCAKLAVTLGRYDVETNVRDAVEYLQRTVARQPPLRVVKSALAWVRAFLHEVLRDASSSAIRFTVPALPEVDQ